MEVATLERGDTQWTIRKAVISDDGLNKAAITAEADGYMRSILACLMLFIFMPFINAQTRITYKGGGNYTLVERTDLRRYDNGRYTGLVSREVRSFITRTSAPAMLQPQMRNTDAFFNGDFYIKQQTTRNSRIVPGGINMSIPSSFRITESGDLVMIEDNGYPSFRSFPAFAKEAVNIGDKWMASAERAVDPLESGIITRLPMTVEYTYISDDVWHGEDVIVLAAKWATRYGGTHGGGAYGGYVDTYGDPAMLRAEGSHDATMYISKRTGAALVVRDKVDETFVYDKGQAVSFKGTISLFTEYPPAINRSTLIPALQRAGIVKAAEAGVLDKAHGNKDGDKIASIKGKDDDNPTLTEVIVSDVPPLTGGGGTDKNSKKSKRKATEDAVSKLGKGDDALQGGGNGRDGGGEPPIKVEDTDSGIRLTMQNLRFVSDSAELLPSERGKVAAIASVLSEVPDTMFLVEGHTAQTGNPRGEQNLSEERARAIAEALASYGIDKSRFICKGSGGRKPVADNTTPQGKAQNRRVEITILE